MARKLKSDRVLFTATFLLVCVSIVMVYSASALVALQRFDQPNLFLTKQALWTALGLAVLAVAMRVDYRTYRNDTFIWSALAFVVLMLIAVLFSAPVNGTRRWFGVGGLGIQPSELAKMTAVVFTALILERRMHRIDDLRYSMLPIAIVVGGLAGLIWLRGLSRSVACRSTTRVGQRGDEERPERDAQRDAKTSEVVVHVRARKPGEMHRGARAAVREYRKPNLALNWTGFRVVLAPIQG